MTRPTKEERERLIAAIRAHAVSGGDLSSSGYAKAAGCSQEAARNTARQLGLPLVQAPGYSPKPGNSTDPVDPVPESPEAAETVPSSPPIDGAPVTRAEVGKLVPAHGRAATQAGPSTDLAVKDPTRAAVLKATSAVARLHVDSVVTQAEQWQTWDEEAGELVRRLWYDRGFRDHFPNPGAMVDDLSIFWWENRDLIPALQEQLEAAVARIDDLVRERDPEVRRREAIDQVWAMALTAAVAGRPLSREDFAYYIQVAEATAMHAPIPAPTPSVSLMRLGG